jgi:hypothetical protein
MSFVHECSLYPELRVAPGIGPDDPAELDVVPSAARVADGQDFLSDLKIPSVAEKDGLDLAVELAGRFELEEGEVVLGYDLYDREGDPGAVVQVQCAIAFSHHVGAAQPVTIFVNDAAGAVHHPGADAVGALDLDVDSGLAADALALDPAEERPAFSRRSPRCGLPPREVTVTCVGGRRSLR